MRSWAEHYRFCCGNKPQLEGNIAHLSDFIVELARHLKMGDSALEIGTGSGSLCAPIAQAGIRVVTLDNEPLILEQAKINARVLGVKLEFVLGEALKLPFQDDSFALSWSHGLIEHFSDVEIPVFVAEHLRVAPVAVIGMPLLGCTDGEHGDERFLPIAWWIEKLKDLGMVKHFVHNEGTLAFFTMARKGKANAG